MSLFGFLSGRGGAADPAQQAAAAQRGADWEAALAHGRLPAFVTARLGAARDGRAPWLSTTTPAELLLQRSHGIRPVATVSGTCWQQYGFSWTRGHAEGWSAAMSRLRQEAVAAGANAVVDVSLRTVDLRAGDSMDFTAVGTAVRVAGLPETAEPPLATVSALSFVRLLEAGTVPVGIAVGAHYEWLQPTGPVEGRFGGNLELTALGRFWNRVRRQAISALQRDLRAQGANGVLGHTWFGELLKEEGGNDKQPPRFLARQIVIGTALACDRTVAVPHGIAPVVDLRDDGPLDREDTRRHTAYPGIDEEGPI